MNTLFKTLRAAVGALSFLTHVAVYAGSLTPGSQVVTGSAIGQIAAANPFNQNLLPNTATPALTTGGGAWIGAGACLQLGTTPAEQWDGGFVPTTLRGCGTADNISQTITPTVAPANNRYTFSAQLSTSAQLAQILTPSTQSSVSIAWLTAGNALLRTDTLIFNPQSGQLVSTSSGITSVGIQQFSSNIFLQSSYATITPAVIAVSFTTATVPATAAKFTLTVTPNTINTGIAARSLYIGGFQLEPGTTANAFIPSDTINSATRILGTLPGQMISRNTPFYAYTATTTEDRIPTLNTVVMYNTAAQTYTLLSSPNAQNGDTVTIVNNNAGQTTIAATDKIYGPGIAAAGTTALAFPPISGTAYPVASITLVYDGVTSRWVIKNTNLGTVAGGIPVTSTCAFTATGLNNCPIGATTANTVAATSITATTGVTVATGQNTLSSYIENTFTVTPTNLTVVGTPTYTGTYTKIGRLVIVQYRIQSTTSTASTAGTTLLNLPVNSATVGGTCTAASNATSASFGVGIVGTTVVAPPTWAAATDVYVNCQYFSA